MDRKMIVEIVKDHIRATFDKKEAKLILEYPEYHFSMFDNYAAAIFWINAGQEFPVKYARYPSAIHDYYSNLLKTKQQTVADAEPALTKKVIQLSPYDLMKQKVNTTILMDFDQLEDDWMQGKKVTLSLPELFTQYEIKGAPAIGLVEAHIKYLLSPLQDAYSKVCEQAVEAYEGTPRRELKRRIDALTKMLAELDQVRHVNKAIRRTKVTKVRNTNPIKQVDKLKYCKADAGLNLISISPVKIIGANRLYAYNIDTKTLTEFVSESTTGLQVKGTTILNFSDTLSRSIRLRKPDVMLPHVLKRTSNQIDKEWTKLTTKTTVNPSGRINDKTLLLRTL
jgi:hypothetical protein